MRTEKRNKVVDSKKQAPVESAKPRNEVHPLVAALGGLGLTPEQVAKLAELRYPAANLLKQGPKAAPDVGEAFLGLVLTTIANAPLLGGPERAAAIKTQLEDHARLQALDTVIGSISTLVRQNLFVVGSELASHVSEVLNTAKANSKKHPGLVAGLAPAQAWTSKHHPGRSTKKVDGSPEKK